MVKVLCKLTWIPAVLKSLSHVKNIYWLTCSSNYSHFLSRKSWVQIMKCCFWKMSSGHTVGRMCVSQLTLAKAFMLRTPSILRCTVRACSSAVPVPWQMLVRWCQLLSSWWLTPFFSFLDLDQIVVTPEETVLNQGDDLPLTCNALSSLPTKTTWFKVQQ